MWHFSMDSLWTHLLSPGGTHRDSTVLLKTVISGKQIGDGALRDPEIDPNIRSAQMIILGLPFTPGLSFGEETYIIVSTCPSSPLSTLCPGG